MKTQQEEKKLRSFQTVLFAGGCKELLDLDLSFVDLKFYKVKSNEFRDIIRHLNKNEARFDENIRFFDEYDDKLQSVIDSLYVLFPRSLRKPIMSSAFAMIQSCLLIMFPSDFNIIADIHFTTGFDNNYFRASTSSTTYKVSELNKGPRFLSFGTSEPSNVSKFIQRYIKLASTESYLDVAIQSYYNSFFQNEMRLCYTTLFICLEAITSAETEITHQLSRYCAVINSRTKEEGRIVYKKTKNLYHVRSRIVHGDARAKSELIKAYYPHLLILASRTLVELLSHNISDKTFLGDKINEHGFGEKNQLSDGYTDYKIVSQHHLLLLEPLPNVSRKK